MSGSRCGADYCSDPLCHHAHSPGTCRANRGPHCPPAVVATLKVRFLALVDRAPRTKGCWLWRGRRGPDGVGILTVDGAVLSAPRLAWQFDHGPLEAEAELLHTCGNPGCVRPDHLALKPAGVPRGSALFGHYLGLAEVATFLRKSVAEVVDLCEHGPLVGRRFELELKVHADDLAAFVAGTEVR